ncbi:hypothetical protein ACFZAE_11525 [Streptomyces scabiei]|uniref:hypothetical protein n=1 Tax=Streptomyces scabiei TaxID=1930 RepID=UPI0036E1AC27
MSAEILTAALKDPARLLLAAVHDRETRAPTRERRCSGRTYNAMRVADPTGRMAVGPTLRLNL